MPSKNRSGFTPIIILALVLIIAAIAGAFYLGTKNSNITYFPTPNSVSNISNWKTYNNNSFGISLKIPYTDWEPETETSTLIEFKTCPPGCGSMSIPHLSISKTLTDTQKLSKCPQNISNIKTKCLISGKNWGQSQDVEPILLDNKKAISFYVYTGKETNTVLRSIQTTETPFVEISAPVDGVGLPEIFNQIISTFKFTQ